LENVLEEKLGTNSELNRKIFW